MFADFDDEVLHDSDNHDKNEICELFDDDGRVVHSELAGGDYKAYEEEAYCFDIKENFSELKEQLLESMKTGLIKELANRDLSLNTYDHKEIIEEAEGIVLSCEDGYNGYGSALKELIRIKEDKILLEKYKSDFLEIGDYVDVVTIKPKENGNGCVISVDLSSGGIDFLGGILQHPQDIFAGVRNEVTYVPGTLSTKSDAKLLEDEKYRVKNANLSLMDAKKHLIKRLEKNKAMTADIKEGMAKTRESGYKHISRTPSLNKGGREE